MKPAHLAAALLMVTIWGFNFVVIRWGLNSVPPLTLTLLRLHLAAFPALLYVPAAPWRLVVGYDFASAPQFSCFGAAPARRPGCVLVILAQVFFTIALVSC
jgi:O-acetylserine/cysteine efflux transporter